MGSRGQRKQRAGVGEKPAWCATGKVTGEYPRRGNGVGIFQSDGSVTKTLIVERNFSLDIDKHNCFPYIFLSNKLSKDILESTMHHKKLTAWWGSHQ